MCNYFHSLSSLHIFMKMSLGGRIGDLKASHIPVWTCDMSFGGRLYYVTSLKLGESGTLDVVSLDFSFPLSLLCILGK